LTQELPPGEPISRRRFLKNAGIAVTSLALGAEAHATAGFALGAEAHAASPQPLSKPSQDDAMAPFTIRFDGGAVTSLKYARDKFDTDYIRPRGRLGDIVVRYRIADGEWRTVETAKLDAARAVSHSAGGQTTEYRLGGDLLLSTSFVPKGNSLHWTIDVHNLTGQPLEIGDLALPLPMNTSFRQGQPATASVLKHSFVSGHGSFFFWMRSNSVGPYLVLTPTGDTAPEYWEAQGGYRVYLHSVAAGADAKAKGCNWRQPHTSLTLAAQGQHGDSHSHGFVLDWANDYDGVRQILVDRGLVDVDVVPGMTVPSDLSARFALRATQKIHGVDAEFPAETKIESLGVKDGRHLYEVRFARLGENRLTVRYGDGRHLFLEFFSTEPVETLIKKRAAFTARHQHRDSAKWYDGLLAEWNMESQTLLGPDNYDKITGWRIYEVTCDDPGLSRPAYLAAKNAEFPVRSEVEALDYYVEHFVWGGLQRTTEETYPYGIYGIPDWKTNRESPDPGDKGKLHIWRPYDYPHIVLTYFGLYKVAKNHPQIQAKLTAREYLQRAYGTALALFTVPMEIVKWSAYETGFYNELVIVELIDALEAEGLPDEAKALRDHWERKVKFFVNDSPDLFGSEYPFDSTGFESTHALAKYALQHADGPGETRSGITREDARKFMRTQMAANIFCRGWIEPAYYLLGSDYRGSAGDGYTLSYMAQMGGWAVLDFGLNFAADPFPYLRLGYASALSSWALMNTGTPDSRYGYWYPGVENDGGAGGGFEPAPYGHTWLDQPHHRGSWYYSCEINLGYCGALRCAATILADDPIFGRICYGGDWRHDKGGVAVFLKDGVRRRFHARLHGHALSLTSDVDRFPAAQPITVKDDLSEIRFRLESDNPAPHAATLLLTAAPGRYRVQADGKTVATIDVTADREAVFEVPVGGTEKPHPRPLSDRSERGVQLSVTGQGLQPQETFTITRVSS
jgi:hypothetical protein